MMRSDVEGVKDARCRRPSGWAILVSAEGGEVELESIVDAFWTAARRGVYYPAEWKGKLTPREAYGVQLGFLDRLVAEGEAHAGWKVGLTARAMQEQWGIYEPVFGFLLASGRRDTGAVFPFGELIQPGFENELCLTIGTRLQGPGVTAEQARAAIAAVAPALEIVERRGDFSADLNLALADNSQQKAFVTGPETTALPPGTRLAETAVEIVVNGRSVESTRGAAERTGDQVATVAWLANKLAEFGRRLEAGQRIMSGSLTRQYPIARGDRVEARFVPFGAVQADFV
jgi:2-keto-4-pentenoate hydratase